MGEQLAWAVLAMKQGSKGERLAGLLSDTREGADGGPCHCKSAAKGITRELWREREDRGRG